MKSLCRNIEAFDELAALARWQAATLRERWWRAYADDADGWRAKIARAEERAKDLSREQLKLGAAKSPLNHHRKRCRGPSITFARPNAQSLELPISGRRERPRWVVSGRSDIRAQPEIAAARV